MKRINVSGLKVHQMQERGILPAQINWVGTVPPSYSLHFLTKPEKKETIIVASDGFGGTIAWARIPQQIEVVGGEMEIDNNEKQYLQERYPALLEAINNF